MIKRVDSWSHGQFSKGGKEVLIKTVLQAIPSYTMACFRVPKSICKEMGKVCAHFWWGETSTKGGVHWKFWNWLCRKKEEGGLNFRRFESFNQALVAKQVWRLLTQPEFFISQVLKARYYKNENIMEAKLGSNPSFVWRSICWVRELLREGLGWVIVKGCDIKANGREWFGSWAIFSPSTCATQNKEVADYITPMGYWSEASVRRDFTVHEAEEILKTKIKAQEQKDSRYCKFHPKENYTMSTGYWRWLDIGDQKDRKDIPECSKDNGSRWKDLWSMKIPPKLRVFWWQISWDILSTEANLADHHVPITSSCKLCGTEQYHILFSTPVFTF